jgi:RNA polymerase sigma-70 factor (ECF subfamily)
MQQSADISRGVASASLARRCAGPRLVVDDHTDAGAGALGWGKMVSFSVVCRAQLAPSQQALGSELDDALATAHATATAAWPALGVRDERFAEQLARRLAGEADPVRTLGQLFIADIYLTVGCAEGSSAALAIIERDYMPDLRVTLSRMGLTASAIDEALQVMREELLVARPAAPPRILGYGGQGPLRGWLRSVAARTGLRGFRKPQIHETLDGEVHATAGEDLELDFLKRKYGDAFRSAFRTAVLELPADDRVLLKQRFHHHLTVEELGTLHGVHAGTISRWVAAARDRLVAGTRKVMMRELGVQRADMSSIMRLIQSEMEISLSALGDEERTPTGPAGSA